MTIAVTIGEDQMERIQRYVENNGLAETCRVKRLDTKDSIDGVTRTVAAIIHMSGRIGIVMIVEDETEPTLVHTIGEV